MTAQALSCGPVYASIYKPVSSTTLTLYPQLYQLSGNSASVVSSASQNLFGIAQAANTNIYFDNGVSKLIRQYTGATTTAFATNWLNYPNSGPGGASDGNTYYVSTNYHLVRVTTTGAITDLGVLAATAGDTIFSTLSAGDVAADGNGRNFWYTSVNGTGASYLYRIDLNTLKATNLGNYGPVGATGAAFDTTGKLISTAGPIVYEIDLSAASTAGTNLGSVAGLSASQGILDLASCNFPTFDPQIALTKTVANITKAQNPATLGTANDVLEYTITVTNTGNIAADSATLSDGIPTGTTYVASSTTLNGTTVADVSSKMFYDPTATTNREIHTVGQSAGIMLVGAGNSAVIKFRVKINSSGLPSSIGNQATANYPKVSGSVTNSVVALSNLSVAPTSDFGDAPVSYDTGTAASHIVPTSPTVYLGSVAPDAESSAGTPLNGTGDDVTGTPDDEDGVTLPASLMLSSSNSVPVLVKGGGYLNGWFDWNRDGDFADAGEQVAVDQVVATGTTNVNVTVPFTATLGISYARFRLCSTANNCKAPGSNAIDGEVEDYQVTINNATAGAAFACDGYFYQIRRVSNAGSRLFRIGRLTGSYSQTQLNDFNPSIMNAMGFNKQDGFLYALASPTTTTTGLMKIGQAGAESIGAITDLPNDSYFSGTFDSAGNYYVLRDTGSPQLYKIDINARTATAISGISGVQSGDSYQSHRWHDLWGKRE
jgi:uncharacterized repeat protein (TIGR01451 family)